MSSQTIVAMVTGASSGMGADFCRQLAGRCDRIIAVARRGDRLQIAAPTAKFFETGTVDKMSLGFTVLRTDDGRDVIVKVPLGTVARDAETGEVLTEITEPDEEKILFPGGRGGKGNAFFKGPTHQSPKYAQPGEEGIEQWVVLELKVLADVGLVGFPNAGKSTLLSSVSAAKPKIGDYPFTTLVPQLGIVQVRDNHTFIMADIPGIIEGAHEGRGLGHRFLRHIERNSILLFMVPADTDRSIQEEYDILVNELQKFNPDLLDKPRMLAISKCDLIDDDLEAMLRPTLPKGVPAIFMSAVTTKNLQKLKDELWKVLNAE